MTDVDRILDETVAAGREWLAANPPAARPDPPTIPYSDLPAADAGQPLSAEWNYYRREAGRLLSAGHEGCWVLVVGESIAGVWATELDAERVAAEHYPRRPVLVHRVLAHEPLLPTPTFFDRCHASYSRQRRTAG